VSGGLVGSALALNSDDELWVPAAARGRGAGQSLWMTDLHVMNLGEETVTVEISWLERNADNSNAASELFEIEGGATLVLEDAVMEIFGLEAAGGAFHIEILEEDEEEKSEHGDDPWIIAQARIYSVGDGGETVGQGFEGVVSDAAIDAEGSDTTHAVGITHDARFRSNWYGVNTSEDETEVLVELLDDAGLVLGEAEYTMPPFAPLLRSIAELGAQGVANAVVRFTVVEGSGIFGVSKIDRLTEDPTTLETHWDCGPQIDDLEFTDEFFIDDCTFSSTGSNPFYIPLEPGHQMFYEGEEDGEQVELRITILNETEMVDGVETRVLEEYETVEGELVEISRNFVAICMETGSVFYFGEDVDIYEDGDVVSHEGAWRAGEDDAEAGILMPGTVLLGSRYYQEVAPGVALDRAQHTAMDVTVETPAGTFNDCLRVDETTPLEPDLSLKFYAPGVGLVRDDILDLVEVVEP
jgi:hypothetical protein